MKKILFIILLMYSSVCSAQVIDLSAVIDSNYVRDASISGDGLVNPLRLTGDLYLTGTAEVDKLRSNSIRADASQYGSSFAAWCYGCRVPEHQITNNAGNYDYTGGTYDNMFTDTVNSPFTPYDAIAKNYIIINSGDYKSAKLPIKTYISATTVIMEDASWVIDFSAVNYAIMPAPDFVFLDGGHMHFHPIPEGHVGIGHQDSVHTYENMFKLQMKAGADNIDNFTMNHNSNGWNNVDAFQIRYNTGDMQEGDAAQVIQLSLNETDATNGEMDLLLLETTDGSDVEKHAIHVGSGFDRALTVVGATRDDMGFGYTALANDTVTDRVNGAAGAGNAFLEAGDDVTIFANDNNYILIGNAAPFEVLEVVLATNANRNVLLTAEYSTGNGAWSTLVVDDGTSGFRTSGLIDWSAPVGWPYPIKLRVLQVT